MNANASVCQQQSTYSQSALDSIRSQECTKYQFRRKTNMMIINRDICITASLSQHEDLRSNLSSSSTLNPYLL